MYLHELGEEAASFTKEEMQQGKHQEYEQALYEQFMNSQNLQANTVNPPTTHPAPSNTPPVTQNTPNTQQKTQHRYVCAALCVLAAVSGS